MSVRTLFAVTFVGLAVSSVPSILAAERKPLEVTPCLLAQRAITFDHERVRVDGVITVGFKDFTLHHDDCREARGWIWIDFGGDVQPIETYCCDDPPRKANTMLKVDGFDLPLLKDEKFRRFYQQLQANSKRGASFRATVVGRFFSGKPYEDSDGKVHITGYGYRGCCSLLVIESVESFRLLSTGPQYSGR